jgi:hypothetical protein
MKELSTVLIRKRSALKNPLGVRVFEIPGFLSAADFRIKAVLSSFTKKSSQGFPGFLSALAR